MQINPKTVAVSLSSQSSLHVEHVPKSNNMFDIMSVVIVCSTVFLVTATCNYLSKVIRPPLKSSATDKLPCRNCQYFNSNYYIKCAVNPNSVLTDRAADCRDYESNNPSKLILNSWVDPGIDNID